MAKNVIEIDGNNFDTSKASSNEVERKVIPDASWGRNLDAFNDILRGGFGTPDGGFVLRWANSARSQETLGLPATIQ